MAGLAPVLGRASGASRPKLVRVSLRQMTYAVTSICVYPGTPGKRILAAKPIRTHQGRR